MFGEGRNALYLISAFRGTYICQSSICSPKIGRSHCMQITLQKSRFKTKLLGFSDGSGVKNLPASVEDVGSTPDQRSSHMPWSTLLNH